MAGNHGDGQVGPGDGSRPTGHMWDRLDAATKLEDLFELRADAERSGYSAEGQLLTAITAKMATLTTE